MVAGKRLDEAWFLLAMGFELWGRMGCFFLGNERGERKRDYFFFSFLILLH